MKEANLSARIQTLKRDLGEMTAAEQAKKLNDIDRHFQSILEKAEKKIKPKGTRLFTLALVGIKQEKRYWKELIRPRKRTTHKALTKIWGGA